MTIFLYGPDTYRLKQGSDQVVSGYKKKYPSGLNIFSFDLSDREQKSRFQDSLKTASLFQEAKLIVVKNLFVSLSEYDADKSKELTVLVAEPVSQKELEKANKKLFKELFSTSATVRNFECLEGMKLVNWVRSEFAFRGCSVDIPIAKELIKVVGNESWCLANEIEKLSNYKQKGTVKTEDIAALVPGRSEMNIFHFVDAVVSRNRAKSYQLLYEELKSGRDPHYLLAMMAYGFRSRASRFSQDDLRGVFGKLVEMDTLSKNGAVNLTDALFEFVIA